jgi:hypothetical protein
MTESSSAGHPDGAALPADHPLGPAAPVPPRDREQDGAARMTAAGDQDRDHAAPRAGREQDGGGAPSSDRSPAHDAAGPRVDGHDDGHPHADRRETVLDPSAGAAGHGAANIRDEQGTHTAGTVPAAFNGTGPPEDPDDERRPEDAEREGWDSSGT